VSVRAGDFVASSASGTVEVLAVAPLRLRLDVTANSADETTMHIQAELRFSLLRERGPCS
jgi:hypothetical protein